MNLVKRNTKNTILIICGSAVIFFGYFIYGAKDVRNTVKGICDQYVVGEQVLDLDQFRNGVGYSIHEYPRELPSQANPNKIMIVTGMYSFCEVDHVNHIVTRAEFWDD